MENDSQNLFTIRDPSSGLHYCMISSFLSAHIKPAHTTYAVCAAAMISLAVAMGVGRFAFTPLFPLMVRDGVLDSQGGGLLAASNYLGYLAGALLAARVRVKPATLLAIGLLATVAVTAAVGWTSSLASWTTLRFIAGVMSAWTLVATSAWGLGWLASFNRPQMAGTIYAGVGTGIAAAGMFCLVVPGPGTSARDMWVDLALLAAIAILIPLAVSWKFPTPVASPATLPRQNSSGNAASNTAGLIVCYTLFGFGYILPATYLPALARELVDDPQIFGWAWPLFGLAAALSTMVVSWGMKDANRLIVWAISHLIMAVGVLLPSIWPSLISVVIAALLVGGTFMVITMLGMQEARARADGNAPVILGRMTAGFAFGQLMGPIASAALSRFTADHAAALNYALTGSAAGLVLGALFLWREVRLHTFN